MVKVFNFNQQWSEIIYLLFTIDYVFIYSKWSGLFFMQATAAFLVRLPLAGYYCIVQAYCSMHNMYFYVS